MTRSVPLMMNVPHGVIMGKSPMKTRCSRITALVLSELHGEGSRVVLDRRDVVDRLAQAVLHEPLEGRLLDIDEVGEVEDVLKARKALARARRDSNAAQM